MKLSEISQIINESATLKLNATFTTLKNQGVPVIHLGGGEPKSLVPDTAIKEACNFLHEGVVRYSPSDGTKEMREAVQHYTEQFYNKKVGLKNIIVSNGAKQSLMVAMQAILNPGDEILFPAPYWVSYPEMAKLVGAKPVAFQPADGSIIPTLDDIKAHCTNHTRAIILNSPNNPTGVQYPESFIKEVIAYTKEQGIYLIMDDIYHRLLFDGRKPYDVYQTLGDDNSHIIVINGVSKTYAMTGFRIGWGIADKTLISVMTKIQSHQTAGPSTLSQKGAIGALMGTQDSVEALRSYLEDNRNTLLEQLKTIPHLNITIPNGTFYSFVDFSYYDKDSSRLAMFLLEKAKVQVMPGIAFGIDGYLRLSFCGSTDDLYEGIKRIRWALDPESPKTIKIGNETLTRD